MNKIKKRLYYVLIIAFIMQIFSPFYKVVQATVSGDKFEYDLNMDGVINQADLDLINGFYNVQKGDTKYKEAYDFDRNGIIDVYDITKVASQIGVNSIPYRVYSSNNTLIGRYKEYNDAKTFTANNKNAYVVDSSGKELWRSRYEVYQNSTLKGRYNTLDEAKSHASNTVGYRIVDAKDNDKIVWQYVDPTVYGIVNTASSPLNVRSGPGSGYSVIGTVAKGSTVVIVDSSNSSWHKIKYGSGYGYVSKSYISIVHSTPSSKTVVLDPGHGGSDPGAIGPSGLKEKDVVLKVGLKARDILRSKGYNVVMTRETDVYVSLDDRTIISNNSSADLFVSIHANSFDKASANGTETFGNPSIGKSWTLADNIQRNMVSSFGLTNRGRKNGTNLYVIRHNNVPAALAELAFISNPAEESLLASDNFQNKAAQAIVKGIEESF